MKRKPEKKVLEVVPAATDTERPPEAKPLLELVTRQTEARTRGAGVLVGRLRSLGKSGEPFVNFPAGTPGTSHPARSTVALGSKDIGREVVLLFEENDQRKPIVIGLLEDPASGHRVAADNQREVELDGERLVFSAQKEIVLRCGEATIVLTRAGKILIRGTYLLNRSSGVNRIKGGSVQIN